MHNLLLYYVIFRFGNCIFHSENNKSNNAAIRMISYGIHLTIVLSVNEDDIIYILQLFCLLMRIILYGIHFTTVLSVNEDDILYGIHFTTVLSVNETQ